jgi:hypothetical protein
MLTAAAMLTGAVVIGEATTAASARTLTPEVAMAGYEAKTAGATSATVTFKVPALTCAAASSAYVAENLEMATDRKKGIDGDAVSSLIGRCLGKSKAGYIELVDFPTISKAKYLTMTLSAGQKVTVKIDDSAAKSSVSVTSEGKTQSVTGPGFSPSKTLVVVVLYPAIAGEDTTFTPVDFTEVKISNKALSTFADTKLKAKRAKRVLAKPTSIVGGDSFKVKYEA